ncbi:hypothetical protein EQG63_00630 [Flavobacterium amnicola]|uniref:LTXXQ motif family protein n=1 Tax=Flavobacterium amnicola TaxID=2506422 RepID=A0A4Q1K427_9FLAO|nr:hypothetical protein [Flavobacterium amnicola]RXR20468.1 hypothetical protein EQG63_00630 [Flavobacterium amnicola]
MKNLILTTVAIVTLSISGIAQERKQGEKLSMEQRNQLQLKKMTMELDLNESQQKEMSKVIAEQNAKREAKIAEMKANKEAKKELTADEKFKKKNEMLDAQIAHKAKMKKILNEKQFEKWDANQDNRHKKMRDHRNKRKSHASEKEIK